MKKKMKMNTKNNYQANNDVNKITMSKHICRMDYVGLNYYVSWQPG